MPNLQEIRQRIGSVKNTQKITRAMKMVAAAKLRHAQELLLSTRPYAYHMRVLTASLIEEPDREDHPLLRAASGDQVRLIVVTSDRGLCGGFNTGIVQETVRQVRSTFEGRRVSISLVGKKGLELLRRRQVEVSHHHTGIFDHYSVNAAVRIVDEFVDEFLAGKIHEVHCIYNEFKTAVTQRIAVERILPYEPAEPESAVMPFWIFEPDRDTLLTQLVRSNLYAQMNRILHESSASEQGARMAAMDAATKNAGDVLTSLSHTYNCVRQDAITREVVEVISGAEAL